MDLNNRLDQSLDEIIQENRKKSKTEMGKRVIGTHHQKPQLALNAKVE